MYVTKMIIFNYYGKLLDLSDKMYLFSDLNHFVVIATIFFAAQF